VWAIQVETFALLLWQLLRKRPVQASGPLQPAVHVVDFGSGSGNLVLPLAYLFPSCTFTAVDMKPAAIHLLSQRARVAGLDNVVAVCARIEEYAGEEGKGCSKPLAHGLLPPSSWHQDMCSLQFLLGHA
jgi:methylase of polypeptide subunit release factors